MELLQKRVMPRIAPQAGHGGVRIGEISELDRPRGTGALAGGDNVAFRYEPRLALGETARGADPLDAIGAFLHDAARAHADVGIVRGLDEWVAEIAIFLAVGVAEEVEAAHFVGAVQLAKARADAAIVDLDVESLMVVHGGFDRANRLAGRGLAMHAGHGLKDGSRI